MTVMAGVAAAAGGGSTRGQIEVILLLDTYFLPEKRKIFVGHNTKYRNVSVQTS